MKTLRNSALALVSALTLAACDGDGGTGVGGLREGQFEGEITGVLDTDLSGEARSGYAVVQGLQDLIVLTDHARDVQVAIYEAEDEFSEGRWRIDDENDFDSRIVAYVHDMATGETFSSVSGTLDVADVRRGGIEGSAVFTAESDDFDGDLITVDVVFHTEYTNDISFSRSPSLNASAKISR